MEDEQFQMLLKVLKTIEQDIRNPNPEITISNIVDDFDKELTDEQCKTIIKEFSSYARIRKLESDKKLRSLVEEESYRSSVNRGASEIGGV